MAEIFACIVILFITYVVEFAIVCIQMLFRAFVIMLTAPFQIIAMAAESRKEQHASPEHHPIFREPIHKTPVRSEEDFEDFDFEDMFWIDEIFDED